MPLLNVKILWKLGIIVESLSNEGSLARGALFYGDIPLVHRSSAIGPLDVAATSSDGRQVNFVCAKEYDRPRPVCTTYKNVTYTPGGYGWIGRKLDISLSTRMVDSTRFILNDRLDKRRAVIERATLIQSQYPNTYGDWTSEHMKSIALCPDFPRPLVLPKEIAGRAYVKSELDRLGIENITIDRPVLIREAIVLHKQRPVTLWNSEDVAAYRRLFSIAPPAPRPGSILYLSRLGVKSEQKAATREYRSDVIAKIVTALGGRVVHTDGMTRDDFAALASEAETVIGDHGAALFNILQWNTRNLIEIVTDTWWSRCFVFLGTSCGVANHAVVRCDPRSEAELRTVLEGHLRAFGALPATRAEIAPTPATLLERVARHGG